MKVLDDYNADSQEGVARMQQNAANGLRYSASRGYIHLDVPTLELQSEMLVTRILIENGRAAGVAVVNKDGPRGSSAPARRSSSRPASSARPSS